MPQQTVTTLHYALQFITRQDYNYQQCMTHNSNKHQANHHIMKYTINLHQQRNWIMSFWYTQLREKPCVIFHCIVQVVHQIYIQQAFGLSCQHCWRLRGIQPTKMELGKFYKDQVYSAGSPHVNQMLKLIAVAL